MSDTLNPKHFELLRLAKLRGLTAKRIGEKVFTVPSHTQRADGISWVVTFGASGLTCSCPAGKLPYCTHRAAAVDHYFINCASPADYTEYTKAIISDRTQLRLRIRAGELTRYDRIYLAYCERVYRAKLTKAAVNVPPITERVVREGRRTRTITRVGSFII